MADDTQTTTKPDALAVREPDQLAQQKPEGMTTAQKVGVGVGVTGATGLAAFGIYKAGQRFGWWGSGGTIVIDDGDDSRKTDDRKKTDGGGSSTRRQRAIGKPPNISGDPEGYNTNRFPHPGAVRLTMLALGYKVEYSGKTLVPNNQPNAEVTRFQREWNKVIRGLDSGKVKFPSGAEDPSKFKQFRGVLSEDGIPGKNTLNGLEIAFNNQLKNKIKWTSLVGQAK